MTTHRLAAILCIFATVMAVVPRSGHAADITVSIPSSYVIGWMDDAINDYLSAGASSFEWLGSVKHLETSTYGAGTTTLHVTLHLVYETTINGVPINVPVDVSFDLVLDCGEDGPFLLLDNPEITTFVSVPASVLNTIKTEANAMLAAKTASIVGPVWNQLDSVGIADVHSVCPHFEVYADGSLYAEVDFVNGCINDRTKHKACAVNTHWGPGYDYVCDNGYWERVSGWCERKPPPGGQVP
jgi:hypothetical protein